MHDVRTRVSDNASNLEKTHDIGNDRDVASERRNPHGPYRGTFKLYGKLAFCAVSDDRFEAVPRHVGREIIHVLLGAADGRFCYEEQDLFSAIHMK